MAIGSEVTTTALTPGADVTTLTKVKSGVYTYVDGSQVPTTLAMKAANPGKAVKSIQLILKIDQGILDSFPDSKAGKISAVVQLNSTIGSVVTDAVTVAFASELGSILGQSAVITALLGGSLE